LGSRCNIMINTETKNKAAVFLVSGDGGIESKQEGTSQGQTCS